MSSKHSNPYNEGKHYGKLFAFWRGKQVVTRDELIAEAVKLGISNEVRPGAKSNISAAEGTVTVLLSPQHQDAVREGADCRGNASAAGHLYYAERLEDRKYRLRWRDKPMEPRARTAVKSAKVSAKAKASHKSPAKKTVKKTAPVATPAVTPPVEAVSTATV